MKLIVVIKTYSSLKGYDYVPLGKMEIADDGVQLDTYISDMCDAADRYCRRNNESSCRIIDYRPHAFSNGRIIVLKTVVEGKVVIQTALMYTTA